MERVRVGGAAPGQGHRDGLGRPVGELQRRRQAGRQVRVQSSPRLAAGDGELGQQVLLGLAQPVPGRLLGPGQRVGVVGGDGGGLDQAGGAEPAHPAVEPGGEGVEDGLLGLQLRAEPGGDVIAGVGADQPVEVGVEGAPVGQDLVGRGEDLPDGGGIVGRRRRHPPLVVQGPQPHDGGVERLLGGGELRLSGPGNSDPSSQSGSSVSGAVVSTTGTVPAGPAGLVGAPPGGGRPGRSRRRVGSGGVGLAAGSVGGRDQLAELGGGGGRAGRPVAGDHRVDDPQAGVGRHQGRGAGAGRASRW